jgi:hypothetical protein
MTQETLDKLNDSIERGLKHPYCQMVVDNNFAKIARFEDSHGVRYPYGATTREEAIKQYINDMDKITRDIYALTEPCKK